MSAAKRIALTAALLAPLVVAVALVAQGGEGGQSPETEAAASTASVTREGATVLRAVKRERRGVRRHQIMREDPDSEAGPTSKALKVELKLLVGAEPVARRFFAAFSLYELGRVDRATARQIERTSTSALARTLASVPRVFGAPSRARLGPVQLGGVRRVRGKAAALELIGRVSRDGRSRTISIQLVRASAGDSWRVAGLGE